MAVLRTTHRNGGMLPRIAAYVFIGLMLVVFTLPTLYALLTSLQPSDVTLNPVPQWIFRPTLENFVTLFETYSFLGPLLNSAQTSIGSAVLAVVISAPAAYALSRARVSSAGIVGFWLLAARALPAIGLAIPAYAIVNQIGMGDSLIPLLVVYLPFNVGLATLMLKVFIDGIPRELDEAAAIDGAGPLRTMLRVVLPIARPGLASVTIMTFLFSWNNFLFPLVLTGSRSTTIPLALQQFLGSYTLQWNQVMAGVVLLSLPLIVLGAFFGRYMVGGLAAGSVK
ncbi:carbohydrate ABC transporter membrane protein 2 (CUT1 family) [Haloactinopolyspora alba]|uniref:Carbohydrate ABC transporter membrane protein 2 (CUT1 family) n=1 Tax=Haloactinopolyspora alba TaxID=648780 RepID=A0A2P8EC52_9ACTN|nr:carbohydrate ABC transporter permease [Haloactinopolyspora alba]PSL07042.1 carbohydrate ABC transporter membrane protein 2 (CUT1 family) [Haloactinopolyspora alba]